MPSTTSPACAPTWGAPRSQHVALAAALAVAALLAGCSGGSSPSTSSSATSAPQGSGFDGAALPGGVVAPGFTLTDQRGRLVSLARYRGQATVLSFLYPTCGPTCILVAQQIRGALDQLPHPVPVLIISADPAADTRANVSRFLAKVSLTGRVEYLSGSPRQLDAIWRSYRITPPSTSRSSFDRGASVLLIDGAGDERVQFGLEQLTPESLVHDIGKLQRG
jgi:cytochrome oxidase Cu insertion factor (SCO1/SenC/PrrC family)